MNQVTINTENLTADELKLHLELTKEDFVQRDEAFISEYSLKLAQNAKFIIARDSDGEMCGLIAYYANHAPNAYVTHVWVSNCNRGGVYVAKCYNISIILLKSVISTTSDLKCA